MAPFEELAIAGVEDDIACQGRVINRLRIAEPTYLAFYFRDPILHGAGKPHACEKSPGILQVEFHVQTDAGTLSPTLPYAIGRKAALLGGERKPFDAPVAYLVDRHQFQPPELALAKREAVRDDIQRRQFGSLYVRGQGSGGRIRQREMLQTRHHATGALWSPGDQAG